MASNSLANTDWRTDWECNIYSQGLHLNRYPHHAVVRFMFRHFGQVEDRSRLRVLELGFGGGNNLWFAAREGFSVAGIEGSASAVNFAQKRFASDGLHGDLRQGSFASLPWDDQSYDIVIDRCALYCADRNTLSCALDETARILKPGGKFFSMFYSDKHPDCRFGRHLGDNTYTDFTQGCFVGLGGAHFCSRDEVDDLFGSRFLLRSLHHAQEYDELCGQIKNAIWHIECENPT